MPSNMFTAEPPTWTAYPSLLDSLGSEEQRAALEEATCATQCGRYKDAAFIYEHKLPASASLPLLAFSHADMLTNQGLERQRKDLLERHLQTTNMTSDSGASQLLLGLMLADSKFWVSGEIKEAAEALSRAREYFGSRDTASLTDVELRCITEYYGIVRSLAGCCNEIGTTDLTAYPQNKGDRALEVSQIRKILQGQSRWRFAPTFMQLEVVCAGRGQALMLAVQTALGLCASLETSTSAPIRFRYVVLTKQVADTLSTIMPPMSANITVKYTSTLRAITPQSFDRWENFCPQLATDQRKDTILHSGLQVEQQLSEYRAFIAEAIRGENYTKTNQIYISTRDTLQKWLEKSQTRESEANVLSMISEIGLEYIEFHRITTGIVYFEAGALGDYLTNVFVYKKNHSEILQRVEEFEHLHPHFDIPSQSERLYDLAQQAADALGRINLRTILLKKHDQALHKCQFYEAGGGLSDAAVSDPDYCLRMITDDGRDAIHRGINSIKLMLRWAAHEKNKGLLSTEEIVRLFGSSLTQESDDIMKTLRAEGTPLIVYESFCGPREAPKSSAGFLRSYNGLLDWIILTDRLPSKAVRLCALKAYVEARLYQYRAFLIKRGELPTSEHAAELELESACQIEIERMEAIENGTSKHQREEEMSLQIQTALTKSYVLEAIKLGLITDEEMVARTRDCRKLITLFRSRGSNLKEYVMLCQLIRLTWQRYVKFGSVTSETVVPLAEEAESAYVRTRNAITGPDASSDLHARVKLSEQFQHREHYNFVLTALFAAQERCQNSEESSNRAIRQDFVDQMAKWSLMSKGRGLIDILQLQASSMKSLQENQQQTVSDLETPLNEFDSRPFKDPSLNESKFSASERSESVTIDNVKAMLKHIPDAVAIDFVNLAYRVEGPTLAALIYRKDVPINAVALPIAMGEVNAWVAKNLDAVITAQDIHPLAQASAQGELAALKNLLQPLFGLGEKPIVSQGTTVILCPTGSLSRVPIHALSIGEGPLIASNPVIYAQSLTLLHNLWSRYPEAENKKSSASTKVVLNPLPPSYESGPVIRQLASDLGADKLARGFDLRRQDTIVSLNGASIFHYHGHAFYDPRIALDSALILNETAYIKAANYVGKLRKPKNYEALPARDIFDLVKLHFPALATLIGCSSGVAQISSTDDVLGLPTALHYAGASSVVSTLWNIDDRDGADFATAFYKELLASAGTQRAESPLNFSLNLAKAMQSAVLKLLGDPSRTQLHLPYHWAAFVLQGLWIFPVDVFDAKHNNEQSKASAAGTT